MAVLSKSPNQGLLEYHLNSIFPQYNKLSNSRTEAAVRNPHTGHLLEVDVWLPDLNLCVEFQDDYHFKSSWYSRHPLDKVQQVDDSKRKELMQMNQTLVVIPYWWSGDESSLKSAIHFQRPDLLPQTKTKIALNPPETREAKLMLSSFPNADLLERAWWIGEKWDGVRCSWSPTEKRLYSRYNTVIDLDYPVDLLADLVLDGELWCGRGCFQEAQQFVSSYWTNISNSFLRLISFDEASSYTKKRPFEMRYSLVLTSVPPESPLTIVAPRFVCSNTSEMLSLLDNVIKGGGEGLMLRKPLSTYIPGRSDSLYKLKAAQSDQEALVVQVEADSSLLLQLPNGYSFTVPKQDCVLPQQPVRGDIVSFCVDFSQRKWSDVIENSKGLLFMRPASPVVYRIRNDLSWDDVVTSPSSLEKAPNLMASLKAHAEEHQDNQTRHKHLNPFVPGVQTSVLKKYSQQESKRREFFDAFAMSKGGDPLNPSFWYGVTRSELKKFHSEYQGVVSYHGGKLIVALMQLYPNIGLQKQLFQATNWENTQIRRAHFDEFAASKGMDPLNPEFWLRVNTTEIDDYRRIAHLYGGSWSNTLRQLYPDISWQKHHLIAYESRKNESERKAYFDEFAHARGGDPLSPSFWYSVSTTTLNNYNYGHLHITKFYGGFVNTLMQLYPNIGLDREKFKMQSRQLESSRRAFFDKFAATKGGDPLNPNFWYSITKKELQGFQGGVQNILSYHGGKVSTTLTDLYPDIGLKKSNFKRGDSEAYKSWKDERECRKLFDAFAKSKGEDPLNPQFWYKVRPGELKLFHPGVQQVIRIHGGKTRTTILSLYPDIGLQSDLFQGYQQIMNSKNDDKPNDQDIGLEDAGFQLEEVQYEKEVCA